MSLDPLFSEVSILCPFETDGQSVAPGAPGIGGYSDDYSGAGRFTGSALYLDGSSDYWYALNSDMLPSGADDFTIEGWTQIQSFYNPINTVFVLSDGSASGIRLSVLDDGSIRLELLKEFFGVTHSATLSDDTWFHWAVTRESGVFNLWINGVGATPRDSAAVLPSTGELYLGAAEWSTSDDELRGYWSELRVTLNNARYTADFTPPSEPFPRYGALIEGAVTDDAGAFAARTVRLYDRATGSLLSTTTSDAVTGAYQFPIAGPGAEYQIVCLDDDAGTVYEDQIKRYTP